MISKKSNEDRQIMRTTDKNDTATDRTKIERRSPFLRRNHKHKRKHRKVQLRDQRTMHYLIDGPDEIERDPTLIKDSGFPVIFAFHGMYLCGKCLVLTDYYRDHYSSRNAEAPFEYIIIAVNRAGYHGSSPVKLGEYSYKEFALDVGEIADSLGISKFGVVGHSSGGPNALACAAILGKDRVTAFSTLGSDPEYSHFDDIPYNPMIDCCIGLWLPRFLRVFFPCIRVANGMRNDYILERKDYPFDCESIEQRGVVIAGEKDTMLPGWLTQLVNDRLQNAEYKVVPEAEHEDLLNDEPLDATYRTVVELMKMSEKKGDECVSSLHNLPIDALIRGEMKGCCRPPMVHPSVPCNNAIARRSLVAYTTPLQ